MKELGDLFGGVVVFALKVFCVDTQEKEASFMRLKPGFTLRDGQYTLQEYLGGGGQADVWRARKKTALGVQLDVALKLATPEHARLMDRELQKLSFLEEAQITEYLRQSEHFIKVRDAFELPEYASFGLELELIEGMTLETLQEEYASQYGKRLPWFLSLSLGYQVLCGLSHAHTATKGNQPLGLIHRDIKPANLMLSTQGIVKILDLGLAKWRQRDQALQTAPGYRRLSYGYAAPEQVVGQDLCVQTDLFAVGAVLYEMLTGRGLFGDPHDPTYVIKVAQSQKSPPESPCRWANELPTVLGDWLLSLLAYAPTDRPESAWLVSEALMRLLKQHQAFLEPNEIARWWQEHFGQTSQPRTHTAWYNVFAKPAVFALDEQEPVPQSSREQGADRTIDEMAPFVSEPRPIVGPASEKAQGPRFSSLSDISEKARGPSFAFSVGRSRPDGITIQEPILPVNPMYSSLWVGLGGAFLLVIAVAFWGSNRLWWGSPLLPENRTKLTIQRTEPVSRSQRPTPRAAENASDPRAARAFSMQNGVRRASKKQGAPLSLPVPPFAREPALAPLNRARRKPRIYRKRPRFASVDRRLPPKLAPSVPTIRSMRGVEPPMPERSQPPSPRRVAFAPSVPAEPKKIALSILVSPPCKLVDAAFRGYGMASRFRLYLPPGTHSFQCVNREKNFFWKFRAVLSEGQTEKQITKLSSMGKIFIRSVPWATISLPHLGRIGHSHTILYLPEGQHRLLLHKEGDRLVSKTLDVAVQAGQELRPPVVLW